MKLHFLGTNGWFDTRSGNTLSVLLDTDKAYIVFDAGGGFYKLDGYIKENIWVISSRANILKNDANIEELDLLVRNLKLCGFT